MICLLASGNSNREIGDALGISDGTVKIHVTHLFAKLDVASRAEANRHGPAAGTRAARPIRCSILEARCRRLRLCRRARVWHTVDFAAYSDHHRE